ncbi:MAG: hypothetical protein ACLFR1_14355 [Spirochaetia bacterium]
MVPACWLLLTAFAVLYSCAGTESLAQISHPAEALPESDTYLSIAVLENQEIVSSVLSNFSLSQERMQNFLENTDRAYIGIGQQEDSGVSKIYLVLIGNYNKFALEFGLGLSGEWEIDDNTRQFWSNADAALQIAFQNSNTIYLSNGHIQDVIQRNRNYVYNQETVDRIVFLDSHDIAAYINQPSSQYLAPELAGRADLSIQAVYLSGNRAENDMYQFSSDINFADSGSARLFSLASRLIFLSWMRDEVMGPYIDPSQIDISRSESRVNIEGVELPVEVVRTLLQGAIPFIQ